MPAVTRDKTKKYPTNFRSSGLVCPFSSKDISTSIDDYRLDIALSRWRRVMHWGPLPVNMRPVIPAPYGGCYTSLRLSVSCPLCERVFVPGERTIQYPSTVFLNSPIVLSHWLFALSKTSSNSGSQMAKTGRSTIDPEARSARLLVMLHFERELCKQTKLTPQRSEAEIKKTIFTVAQSISQEWVDGLQQLKDVPSGDVKRLYIDVTGSYTFIYERARGMCTEEAIAWYTVRLVMLNEVLKLVARMRARLERFGRHPIRERAAGSKFVKIVDLEIVGELNETEWKIVRGRSLAFNPELIPWIRARGDENSAL